MTLSARCAAICHADLNKRRMALRPVCLAQEDEQSSRDREREEKGMEAFRTTLFLSVAAFLIGSASAAPGLDLVVYNS
jgi:hypothetical protein